MMVTGGLLALMVSSRNRADAIPESIVNEAPRHPVTAKMISAAEEATFQPAKDFAFKDTAGGTSTLFSLNQDQPVMLVYILDGCPCSAQAEPFWARLEGAYGKLIHFRGITNVGMSQAKDWQVEFNTPYPLIPAPDLKPMKLLGARESAYSVLIYHGKIVKMWPGFSQAMLQDMSATLAKSVGVPPAKLDFSDAPIKPWSGCYFY